MNLQGRNLLKETDLSAAEFLYLVDLGGRVRLQKRMGLRNNRLAGRNIALIFEKTSTRTRSAFEVAAHDEAAHVTYLGPDDSQLGRQGVGEGHRPGAGPDVRRDRIPRRRPGDGGDLGAWAGVPVWNGLTDDWHPTQMLADILTMR
jgi:ornithine carbamoyltransferase